MINLIFGSSEFTLHLFLLQGLRKRCQSTGPTKDVELWSKAHLAQPAMIPGFRFRDRGFSFSIEDQRA